jgi:hypothetical protein
MELEGVGVPPETHYFTRAVDLVEEGDFPLNPQAVRAFVARFASLDVMSDVDLRADAVIARLPGGVATNHTSLFCAIVDALTPMEARVLGEKTPFHIRVVDQLSILMPDVKFIGVVRDPRGRALSLRGTPWGTRDPYQASLRWNSDQGLLLRAYGRLSPLGRMIVVRYEDAVLNTATVRAQIAQFLGVAASPVNPVMPHELALPWEWWKERAAAPPAPSRVDAWRQELPERDAKIIAAMTAPTLKRFGYQVGRRGLRARLAAFRFSVARTVRTIQRESEHRRRTS